MSRGALHLVLGVVVAGLVVAGCKRLETGAREEFAKKYSCPEDRVTVRTRSDLSWSALVTPPPNDVPPDEVKGDPARLAKWHADKDAQRAATQTHLDKRDVLEVNGCDHDVFMACWHPPDEKGSLIMNRFVCAEAPPQKR